MSEKRFVRNIVGQIYDIENNKFYNEDYQGKSIWYEDEVVALLNHLNNENEELKQNIGIILKYCRDKGKYAMNRKEIEAHNILQRIVNDLDGDV